IGNAEPVVVGADDNARPELNPSCSSASGEAVPAVRIKQFLEQFPQRNTVTTICNDNLEPALVLIAQLLAKVIGNPCLEGKLWDKDGDPSNGVQPECQVMDVRFPNTAREEQDPLPNCAILGGA